MLNKNTAVAGSPTMAAAPGGPQAERLLQAYHDLESRQAEQLPLIVRSPELSVSVSASDALPPMPLGTFAKTLQELTSKGPVSLSLEGLDHPLACQWMDDYLNLMDHFGVRCSRLLLSGQRLHLQLGALATYAYIIDGLEIAVTPGDDADRAAALEARRLMVNLEMLRELNLHEQFFPLRLTLSVTRGNLRGISRRIALLTRYVRLENLRLEYLGQPAVAGEDAGLPTWREPCPQAFRNLHVRFNGDVAPCGQGYHPLGNIHTHDPDTLINSPEILQLRLAHLERNTLEMHACGICSNLDPRIRAMFRLYADTLLEACRCGGDLDMDAVQGGIDTFFYVFGKGWPDEERFHRLLRSLPAPQTRPQPVGPAAPRPLTVGVFGDSLSLPRGKTWGDLRLEDTYPVAARNSLRGEHGIPGAMVLVWSKRSTSIGRSVEALGQWTQMRAVDVAVLHGGIVDCCPRLFTNEEKDNLAAHPPGQRTLILANTGAQRPRILLSRAQILRTPLPEYETALRRACELCLNHGVLGLAMLTTAPASEEHCQNRPGLRANIEAYNRAIREVAEEYGQRLPVRLIDAHALTLEHGPEQFLLPDHQHLSPTGGAVLGRLLADFAAELARSRS